MKLLRVSLLMLLAFLMGITFYRAWIVTPAPTTSAPAPASQPDAPAPESTRTVVLAKSADFTDAAVADADSVDLFLPSVSSFDMQVAEAPREVREFAESEDSFVLPKEQASDDLPLPLQQPEQREPQQREEDKFAEPGTTESPADATFVEALPEGGRLRMQSGEMVLEADRLVLENSPVDVEELEASGQRLLPLTKSDDAPSIADATEQTPRAIDGSLENPIPEFLRGQQLQPLVAGQKVVTIQVPVDNWVDLGWGDFVKVGQVVKGASDTGGSAEGTVWLDLLSRIQIYALPQFAPERAATVPVCLAVNAEQARELLKTRGHGTFLLTVVQKYEPAFYISESTPSPAYESVESQPEPRGPEPTIDTSTPRGDDEFAEQPTYELAETVEPTSPEDRTDAAEPGTPPTTYAVESEATEPTVPFRAPLDQSGPAPDQSLPTIEPSEAGTIQAIGMGSELSLAAGSSLVIEDMHGEEISRVAGFDPSVIRVTALSRKQLQLEGLTNGTTVLTVTIPGVYRETLRVPVHVHMVGLPEFSGVSEETDARVRRAVEERQREEQARAQHESRAEVIATLADLYPDADLQVKWVQDSLLLRGTVTDVTVIEGITEVAEQFAPRVLNQLRVSGPAPIAEAPGSPGVEVPPDMAVVVLTNVGVRQLRGLTPKSPVDVYRIGPQTRFEKVCEHIQLLAIRSQAGAVAAAALLVTPDQNTLLSEVGAHWWLVPHGVQPVLDSVPIDANGAPIHDPTTRALIPEPSSLPDGHRVVVVQELSAGVLQRLSLGQNVDLTRMREVRSVQERDGHAEEIVQRVVEVVAPQAIVFNVQVNDDLAAFIVTTEQAEAIESIPSGDIQVALHRPAADAPDGLGSRHDSQVNDDSEPSLRDEIRALHDDVRRLITLLEQRVSESPASGRTYDPASEFERPAPETGEQLGGSSRDPDSIAPVEPGEPSPEEELPVESVPPDDTNLDELQTDADPTHCRHRQWAEFVPPVSPLTSRDRKGAQPVTSALRSIMHG